jgi:hypothetical protein
VQQGKDLLAQIPSGGHERGSDGLNGEEPRSGIGVRVSGSLKEQRGADKEQNDR